MSRIPVLSPEQAEALRGIPAERCLCGETLMAETADDDSIINGTVGCDTCGWRVSTREYKVYRGYVPKDHYAK